MTKRNLLIGVLAGVAMFFWGFISHVVLGLGDTGIRDLTGEEKILPTLREHIKESGFYFFPGEGGARSAGTKEQQEAATKAWQDKFKAGPWGILVYHPEGTTPMSPGQLGRQLLTDVVLGLLMAFLLGNPAAGLTRFGPRVVFVAVIGLIAGIAVLVPYWNWYGFPANFTVASLADQLIAFCVAGVVLASLIKPTAPVSATQTT